MPLLIRNRFNQLGLRYHIIDLLILFVQMLINSLTEVKDQQLLNFEHINVTCSALMDHVTKVSPTPLIVWLA